MSPSDEELDLETQSRSCDTKQRRTVVLRNVFLGLGFSIAAIGFLIGATGGDRQTAMATFMLGFVMIAIPIMLSFFSFRPGEVSPLERVGAGLMGLGIGICLLGGVVFGYLIGSEAAADKVFYGGFALLVLGLILNFIAKLRR